MKTNLGQSVVSRTIRKTFCLVLIVPENALEVLPHAPIVQLFGVAAVHRHLLHADEPSTESYCFFAASRMRRSRSSAASGDSR